MDEKIFNKGYKYNLIKTKRLILVKPDLKYKEELYNLYINTKIWVYNGGGNNNYSPNSVIIEIKKKRKLWLQKKMVSFFIIYKNKFVGTISLNNISPDFKNAQVGFILLPDYWDKGLMSEALFEFMNFIFKNTNLFRISAEVCTKNIGSVKVLEKNKFKREGILKKSAIYNGKVYDKYLYASLK